MAPTLPTLPPDAIAIVGLACRLPGAATVEAFWQNLCDGVEATRFFTPEELIAAGLPANQARDPEFVAANASLDGVDLFDAGFFELSPRVAELTDPQQRVFLELAWEALERAGYDPGTYSETNPGAIGIFAGVSLNSYLLHHLSHAGPEALTALGELQAAIGNRTDHLTPLVAYKLNLRGPAVTVQTTCSTSLVAVHLACQSLLDRQCSMALAGGVRVQVPQVTGYRWERGGIFSRSGRCRPFDAAADGTFNGSGAGLVVLRRLEDAVRDGDWIHAVIRGSAINNDGAAKVGYTAPSVEGQARVITTALAVAGVHPDEVGYVEAHGTATPLGDPIEVAALTRVFRAKTQRRGFCALGSVKSNLGHLDTAAGIAGLIKTTLALEHGEIPPTLHFTAPNPELGLDESPFFVAAQRCSWPAGRPRRAGVSSFGIGGTNAHVVVEAPPERAPSGPSRPWQLLVLSARTPAALERHSEAYRDFFEARPELPAEVFADAAFTLRVGRRAMEQRRVVVCRGAADAARVLRTLDSRRVFTSLQEPRRRRVVFLLPGQGSQFAGMAAQLHAGEPVFRAAFDRCAARIREVSGRDLHREVLQATAAGTELGPVDRTDLAQPALFAVEWALAALWREWGVRPDALLGHSVGELVAATLAGVFTLDDALALVCERGRRIQDLAGGAMVTVHLPEEELAGYLAPYEGRLTLAAVNRPGVLVVAGTVADVEALTAELSAAGHVTRRLRTSHAFHSPLVEPAVAGFVECVARVPRAAPTLPFISNLTGDWITAEQATDPAYWGRHLRHTVRFGAGLDTVFADPDAVLLEVGPGTVLSSLSRQHPGRDTGHVVLSSLPHPQAQNDDHETLLTALGRLWLAGVAPDWAAFSRGESRRRVVLPSYPFERRRYWLETPERGATWPAEARAGERRPNPGDWFWAPSWRRVPAASAAALPPGQVWWLIGGPAAPREALAAALAERGAAVHVSATVNPLEPLEGTPARIVYLAPWGERGSLEAQLDAGFRGLAVVARALGRFAGEGFSCHLDVLTDGAEEVLGGDLVWPEKATVLGPVLVLPREVPGLTCRAIDLEPGAGWALPAVLGELLAPPPAQREGSARVALRGAHRWVSGHEPLPVSAPAVAGAALRPRGVYLITGGFGGMGLTFAERLAREVGARLVLVGRHLPRAGGQLEALERIEAAGGEVLALAADVSQPADVARVLAATRERFGALHGVIHAAGTAPGGLLQWQPAERAEAVLAPKVAGTRHLAAALAERPEPLDFFVLCSSRSVALAPAGAADYVAANAYQDAFAAAVPTVGPTVGPTLSVEWCGWRDVGMLAQAVEASAASGGGPTALELPPGEPVATTYPWFDHLYRDPASGVLTAETAFGPRRHWLLDEHRIGGNAVLVGTTYLELVRAGMEVLGEFRHGGPLEIRDLFFLMPVRVRDDEERTVRLRLTPRPEGGYDFRVTQQIGRGWDDVVVGVAEVLAADVTPPAPVAVDALCVEANLHRGVSAVEEELREDLGPRWQTVTQVYQQGDEALGALDLPLSYHGDLEHFLLHPALLDRAISLGVNYLAADIPNEFYLPMAYERLRFWRPLPARLTAYVRRVRGEQRTLQTITFDVQLRDAAGEVVVDVVRFSRKKVGDAWTQLRGLVAQEQEPSPAAGTPSGEAAGRFDAVAHEGLSPEEGAEVLLRLLAAGRRGLVVVSPDHLPAAIDRARSLALQTVRRTLGDRAAGEAGAARAPREGRERSLATPYAAPETALEKQLAALWQEALGLDQVGLDDNYFELGGDSVLGIQIISRARKLGLDIGPGELFELPSVRDLARALSAREAPAANAVPAPAPPPPAAVPAVAPKELDKLAALLSRADRPRGGGG